MVFGQTKKTMTSLGLQSLSNWTYDLESIPDRIAVAFGGVANLGHSWVSYLKVLELILVFNDAM